MRPFIIALTLALGSSLLAQSSDVVLHVSVAGMDRLVDESFTPRPLLAADGKPFTTAEYLNAAAALPLPNGSLLFAGYGDLDVTNYSTLIRVNSDGTMDSAFALTFAAALPWTNYWQFVAFTAQADGRVLLAYTLPNSPELHLVRLSPDGSVDPGFAAKLDFPRPAASLVSQDNFRLLLQPDGSILVGEILTPEKNGAPFVLRRLNPNGSADAAYQVSIQGGGAPLLALRPDGRLLALGSFTNVNGTARKNFVGLNLDGSIDSSFMPPPIFAKSPPPPSAFIPTTLAVARDGKILASSPSGSLVRMGPNGDLDPTFSSDLDAPYLQFELPDGSWFGRNCPIPCYFISIQANGAVEWLANPSGSYSYSQFVLQGDGSLWATRAITDYSVSLAEELVRLHAPPPTPRGLTLNSRSSNGQVDLSFETSYAAGVYVLEASADLKSWLFLGDSSKWGFSFTPSDFANTMTDSAGTSTTAKRFYRVRQENIP